MKLQSPFIQLPVTFDAAALAEEVLALDESCWRDRAVGVTGNSALTLVTAGGDPDNDDLSGEMRPTPWLERCPYVMQVLDTLGATWGRSRLMRLSGRSQVAAHVDTSYYWRDRMRVHIPIVTTPAVRFQCGDAEVHMATGECWIFDTWRRHRVVNESDCERIHLVADTVGGRGLWELIEAGRSPSVPARGGWQPRHVAPQAGGLPRLDFESVNVPTVMTPWELRSHIGFVLGEAAQSPYLPGIHQALARFSRGWQALWACYGESREGWPRYRELLEVTQRELAAAGADQVGLRNEVGLMQALVSYVFAMALADGTEAANAAGQDVHGMQTDAASSGQAATAKPARARSGQEFDRPVFIVSPPRSGSTLLFETLSKAPGLYTIGDESHALIEGVSTLSPVERGYDSNRLVDADATDEVAARLRERFFEALRDRDGKPPGHSPVRMLEKTPKNALRIPFLRQVFPQARFIYLHRDPRQVLASMMNGWASGRFRMYAGLPGWSGLPWSFLLTPGWKDLVGKPLHEIVGAQWACTTRTLLDDLEPLPETHWTAVDYASFVDDPQGEIERLCRWAGLPWDKALDRSLPLSRYTLSKPDPDKWRQHEAAVEEQVARHRAVAERAARVAAEKARCATTAEDDRLT